MGWVTGSVHRVLDLWLRPVGLPPDALGFRLALGRLCCDAPVARLLGGAGRLEDLLTGAVFDLRGGDRELPPVLLDRVTGLLLCFFDAKSEKMPPPLDFSEEFRWRCLEACFISSIPRRLILSSPTNVPLILTNHPWTVEDLILPLWRPCCITCKEQKTVSVVTRLVVMSNQDLRMIPTLR